MWNIGGGIALGILAWLSYSDIRLREVPVNVLRACAAAVLLYGIFFRDCALWELLDGGGIGLLFLFMSRLTGEGIGYGDSWGILILGGYLGIRRLLEVLAAAFLLLSVFAVIVLSRRRMSRRCGIPFFPFLTCGYAVLMLSEGGML